jgi:hypothetical protein
MHVPVLANKMNKKKNHHLQNKKALLQKKSAYD